MAELASNWWWALLAVGLAAGVLSGSLGVGSGIVFVPALVVLFTVPQKSAQGIALAVMVPMALLGAFRYWRNPAIEINFAAVGLLVAGALVGVLIGTALVDRVPAHWLRRAFAGFMVIVAVKMFTMAPKPKPTSPGPGAEATITQVEGSDND